MNSELHRLIKREELSGETFVLHFERNDFQFSPGQYAVLRDTESGEGREYSIYSGQNDDYLSFLVREIEGGEFSHFLRNISIGTEIKIEGPMGFFILDNKVKAGHPVWFVASGTGISPFHSFVTSFEDLNYQILHGVRFVDEAYGRQVFDSEKYCLCTSRHDKGDYFGRVTHYLEKHPVDSHTICYLCGNSQMIEDVSDILEAYGISPENIRTEVFF